MKFGGTLFQLNSISLAKSVSIDVVVVDDSRNTTEWESHKIYNELLRPAKRILSITDHTVFDQINSDS